MQKYKTSSSNDSFENPFPISIETRNKNNSNQIDYSVYEYEYPNQNKIQNSYYKTSSSVVKSKIENKRNLMKKEKSCDSLKFKMKRSESWDAKNKLYSKYSFIKN